MAQTAGRVFFQKLLPQGNVSPPGCSTESYRVADVLSKPKHSSAIIEYYRALLEEKGRKGKWEEP